MSKLIWNLASDQSSKPHLGSCRIDDRVFGGVAAIKVKCNGLSLKKIFSD